MPVVPPGDRDDKPEVGTHHPVLGLHIPFLNALGEVHLLVRGQKGVTADLIQEEP
jgi:hypothetical protein